VVPDESGDTVAVQLPVVPALTVPPNPKDEEPEADTTMSTCSLPEVPPARL